jgi:UDP-GlcNAc3NAcA epimerase
MKRIITVVGARPQIIKAAALSRVLRTAEYEGLQEILLHTGQHYDDNMSGVFFREMDIPEPDVQLDSGSGSHGAQTAKMLSGIEQAIRDHEADGVLVYGDTNSTLAAALAASKMHVPVFHVEAGLRSFDKRMPEEINRIACDHVSTLLFSPTRAGISNLQREGFDTSSQGPYHINAPGVFHCGDVMLDNTLYYAEKAKKESTVLRRHALKENEFVLATVHRDSNTDDPGRLAAICSALAAIADSIPVVFPIHPRTKKCLEAIMNDARITRFLEAPGVKIIPPVSFLDITELERACAMVVTDSGGVQKEAFFLKKPCIILRPHTEWIEIVESGHAILADADTARIMDGFTSLRNKSGFTWPELFGDGHAARFIADTIRRYYL